MKTIPAIAIAATLGTGVIAVAPADARDGCGPGFHAGPRGRCFPNQAGYFDGHRGYWDGHRYWQHRERFQGGWRYR
ncbi:GCG_CRPN prefix-to-repeats domain-containing protein [uncultured Sphingomonas sp.]|uniref:GCG_CRPN prefix-to-repeats domain-containing protein n=1 Tax=uncultured Sphingomonas sp. TaxID=158754 RepID=UPI0035CBCD40